MGKLLKVKEDDIMLLLEKYSIPVEKGGLTRKKLLKKVKKNNKITAIQFKLICFFYIFCYNK